MASRDLAVNLLAKTRSFDAGMKRAEGSVSQLGSRMQSVGRTMTTRLTIPLVAAGGAAVKAAVDWESAWAGVTKTVDGSAEQMSALQQELRDMAKELPATHQEIAAVAEAAGQLGVGVDDVADFTRVMIDLGETTNLSADEAATALARFMNIMGTSQADVSNLGSTVVDLGNNFATTEAEIVTMSTRLAAAGRLAGLSESDVLAFATALTSVGVNAEAGGTAFSKVFREISVAVAEGGEDLETFASVAGVSASEFRRAYEEDAAGAIATFIIALGAMPVEESSAVLADLGLSGERVQRSLLSAGQAGELLTDALDRGGQAWEDNTALADEAAKRYDTAGARFEMVRNQLRDLFVDLGEIMLPFVESAVGAIGGLAETFQGLPEPVQALAVALGGLLAVAGPLVFIAGSLVRNFLILRTVAAPLLAALAAHPFVAVAAGIGAAAFAVFALGNRSRVSTQEVQQLVDVMEDAGGAAEGFEEFVQRTVSEFPGFLQVLTDAGSSVDELISKVRAGGDEYDAYVDNLIKVQEEQGILVQQDVIDFFEELPEKVARSTEEYERNAGAAKVLQGVMDGFGGDIFARTFEEIGDLVGLNEQAWIGWKNTVADAALATGDFTEGEIVQFLKAMEEVRTQVEGGIDPVIAMETVFGDLDSTVGELPPDLQALEDGLVDVGDATEDATDAIGESEGALLRWADALESGNQLVEDGRQRWDAWRDAINDAVGSLFAQQDAAQRVWRAVRDVRDITDENTRSLEINTDEGDRNVDLVQEHAEAILDLANQQIEHGHSLEFVTGEFEHNRKALLDNAEDMGFNREAVDDLLRSWGVMPDLVSTTYRASGINFFKERVLGLIRNLEDIPEDVASEVQLALDEGDFRRAHNLLDGIDDRELHVPVRMSAPQLGFVQWDGGARAVRTGTSFFAHGGFGDFGSGTPAMLHGREAVLPLSQPGRMTDLLSIPQVFGPVAQAFSKMVPASAMSPMGGVSTMNVTVNMPPGSDGEDVVRALRKFQRQNGPVPITVR